MTVMEQALILYALGLLRGNLEKADLEALGVENFGTMEDLITEAEVNVRMMNTVKE